MKRERRATISTEITVCVAPVSGVQWMSKGDLPGCLIRSDGWGLARAGLGGADAGDAGLDVVLIGGGRIRRRCCLCCGAGPGVWARRTVCFGVEDEQELCTDFL